MQSFGVKKTTLQRVRNQLWMSLIKIGPFGQRWFPIIVSLVTTRVITHRDITEVSLNFPEKSGPILGLPRGFNLMPHKVKALESRASVTQKTSYIPGSGQ